jgi:hypothetical protein
LTGVVFNSTNILENEIGPDKDDFTYLPENRDDQPKTKKKLSEVVENN